MKNDCERDYIKEAFDKLYNCVMPYINLKQFADADTAFKELDKKVHSEIYILKKCLAESNRAVDAGLTRSEVDRERISDLEKELAETNQRLNHERKHGEDLADINGQLASENIDLKTKTSRLRAVLENSRITWSSRAHHAEKEVEDLNKKIHELEEENANLRVTVTPFDILEALKKENSELKTRNERLKTTCESRLKALFEARIEAAQYKKSFMEHYEENDRLRGVVDTLEKEINDLKKKIHELEEENIHKRPWHGDANAMTGGRTCCESLTEAIEFQNKKQENVDLSYGHEFEFGDEVFVPWSDGPYMYVKCGMMYNPRTERLVYVGKTQHLKWFGEKFAIV